VNLFLDVGIIQRDCLYVIVRELQPSHYNVISVNQIALIGRCLIKAGVEDVLVKHISK